MIVDNYQYVCSGIRYTVLKVKFGERSSEDSGRGQGCSILTV